MVLQHGVNVPVWGTSAPEAIVIVVFANQTQKTKADKKGNWILKLKPLPVSFTPAAFKISAGKEHVIFSDILVGEVWLCSGQSNMYMPLGPSEPWFHGAEGAGILINKPPEPTIRLFCNSTNKEWNNAGLTGWQRADSVSRRAFSAVGLFFAEKLKSGINTPIGLLDISASGTAIQSWMPPEVALQDTLILKYRAIIKKNKNEVDNYFSAINKYVAALNANRSDVPAPKQMPGELMLAITFNDTTLFNTQIKPIIPFAIRGVLWYQGESNSFYQETANVYDRMLANLIRGWYKLWKQPVLPFYLVQLPCWNKGDYWMITRDKQLKVSQSIKNVELAVTLDISDSTNLHPQQKKQVGERLAKLVLAKTYKKRIAYSGPSVKKVSYKRDYLLITFDTGGGDVALYKNNWNNIEIAGADGLYKPAQAIVSGNKAKVWNSTVSYPVSFRYGWKSVFAASLFNSAGFPASPFIISYKDSVVIKKPM
jgi:sialate O-acetylesterase